MTVTTRVARMADEPAIVAIDLATWSPAVTPAPYPEGRTSAFSERRGPEQFVVAESGGEVVGWSCAYHGDPTPARSHVLDLEGFAVRPDRQGEGIGSALLGATIARARERGARKLSLRVLSTNPRAIALYARAGFEVEALLREQFLIDGAYVDDLTMGLRL